ncbi:MAG: phytoene desaturase family protein, partial [Candidatus Brocadiaceae bacterium]|jgi:phytoene desaturase
MEFVRLEPMYRLVFGEFAMDFTTDHERMKQEIRAAFPGREDGLDAFMEKERAKFRHLFPCLQKPYVRWTSLFTPVFLKALPYLDLRSTVMENVLGYFGEESLGVCFSFQSKYLGMSPWDCPAAFTILPYIEHEYGVYHVMGGLSEISAAMAKVVEEEGGEIHLETPVTRLVTEGREVRGVELEGGERVYGDEVVLNSDFGYAMSELVGSARLKKWGEDKLRDRPFSCSTFMLYLGLDKVYDLPHHSIIFADDYLDNLEDVFKRKTLSDDMSYYIRNATITDPTLAPEGKSAVYVLVPVPNQKSGIDWEQQREPYRDRVLEAIESGTCMSDVRQHIEAERVITPLDWEQEYNVFLGATFNLAHTLGQMMYFRPRNRFEELEHCYLVGGGTHPGSGVPTILESGRISANLICDHYDVPYPPPAPLPEMGGDEA